MVSVTLVLLLEDATRGHRGELPNLLGLQGDVVLCSHLARCYEPAQVSDGELLP